MASQYVELPLTGSGSGVITVSGTAPISSSGGTTPAISLNNTAVTPGSYLSPSITIDAKGRITAAANGSTAAQSTLTGSAGTAICSQPEQGSSYKLVCIYLNGYSDTDTQIYTFPIAFTHTPALYGLTAGVAGATVTTTTIKFTVTTLTGFVFAGGF